MSPSRAAAFVKGLCAALLALAGICVGSAMPAVAQGWPTKPVRIVNTFAPVAPPSFSPAPLRTG